MKNHIIRAFKKIKDRNWDTIDWAIDRHETCIVPTYDPSEIATEFYPLAKETLIRLTQRADSRLILFTCSHDKEVGEYLNFFKQNGIVFSYVNENPEVQNTHVGNFERKWYFNILLEDKAGFDPVMHWVEVNEALDLIDAEA